MSLNNAFVTGATGIVGAPLCCKLADVAVAVTAFSRTEGRFVFPRRVGQRFGDILDREILQRAVEGSDVIFHAAAAVHGSAKSLSEFIDVNVCGTENVISVARDNGAKLIYVSSVNVAGFRKGELHDPYAESKSQAEELVAEAASEGLEAVIVRPATVFGEKPGGAGLVVERLLAGKLRVLPAPSRMISPVWSSDLADALIGAARVGELGKTYTVAGPTMSTQEFVRVVCESGRFRKPLISIPASMIAVPLRLAWWVRGITRWTPSISVESLLHESIHDGTRAAQELGYRHTAIETIFGSGAVKRSE